MIRIAWTLLVLFVFTIPWEKSFWIPGIGTIARLLGICALAAGLMAAVSRRSLRLPNLVLLGAALFALWESLSWFWSLDPSASAARALTFLQLFGMLWLIWDQCRSESTQRQLLHAYVAGAVVASVYTIVRYALNQQTYWRRYAAAGFDPNDLGLTVALAIPLALFLALRGGWTAWLFRGAVALIEIAVLLTASRTALIVTVLAFSFVVLTWRESPSAQRAAAIALLVLLGAGTLLLAPRASRERLATLPGELAVGTLHNRTRIWKTGLQVLKQHPMIGVGAGAYPEAVKPWLGVPSIPGHEYVAHNTFLSVLVETGLVGFGVFSGLLAAVALFIWILPGAHRALWISLAAVWAVGVCTLTWEHRKPTWLFVALVTTAWARAFWPSGSKMGGAADD
jgi:O-antigen ligase